MDEATWRLHRFGTETKVRLQTPADDSVFPTPSAHLSAFTSYLGFQTNSDEWTVMGFGAVRRARVKLDASLSEACVSRQCETPFWEIGSGSFSRSLPAFGSYPPAQEVKK